jgi:hypothetical protein
MGKEIKTTVRVMGHRLFEKHNDLLNRYFEMDNEKGIATVRFHYDHFNDMLRPHLGSGADRFLNADIIENVDTILNTIPVFYQIHFIFEVKDFDGYTPEQAKAIFEENYQFIFYSSKIAMRRKSRVALGLAITGILFLVLNILAISLHFGKGTLDSDTISILSEIIDIIAWVFLWESASIFFFDRSQIQAHQVNIRTRISNVLFQSPVVPATPQEAKPDSTK